MSTSRTLLAALALTLVAGTSAQAQLSFGLAGGATTPSGSLNDRQELGYNGLVTAQLGLPLLPFQIRADLQYNSFGAKNFNNVVNQADARIISGTVNGVINLLPGPIKPYVIGGVGYYDTNFKGSSASTRKLGYNYGAGVKFGLTGASLFIEARMHQVNEGSFSTINGRSTAKFIPVSVGILF